MIHILKYFDKMKNIQIKLNDFIENEDNDEEYYESLINLITDEQIFKDRGKFKLFLQSFSNLIQNHYRNANFINKIQKIFQLIKYEIKQTFTNHEIFDFFKDSKIILLFLIKENIITMNKNIANTLINDKYKFRKYPEYFFNEIKPFIDDDTIENFISDDYESNRENGENEKYVCKLIREDSIDKFITYVNQKDLYLQTTIDTSIFETNLFLLKKPPNLIEYSAFYGSVSIFKYIYFNIENIQKSSMIWFYAIHGNNPELISFLEDNKIEPDDKTYNKCLKESIKCHHNDLSNYILNKYFNEEDNENINFYRNKFSYAFHYHNYLYLPTNPNNNLIFFYACRYDYEFVVKYFLQNKLININDTVIQNQSIFE